MWTMPRLLQNLLRRSWKRLSLMWIRLFPWRHIFLFWHCGDSLYQGRDRECDDGNTTPFDGCNESCTIEYGHECTINTIPQICFESCGDAITVYAECDDGNSISGDGCDSNCLVETGFECNFDTDANADSCLEICSDGFDLFSFNCDVTVYNGCNDSCEVDPGYTCI